MVKISSGIVSGSISRFSRMLLCFRLIVRLIFIVLRKLSVGVLSSKVSVSILVLCRFIFSSSVVSGEMISSGRLFII